MELVTVWDYLIAIVVCGISAMLYHEFGHFITALILTGKCLKFRFAFGRYYVPRFVWTMPDTTKTKQKIIAMAGFCFEVAMAEVLYYFQLIDIARVYTVFALIHIIAYKFYAGEDSDFNWF